MTDKVQQIKQNNYLEFHSAFVPLLMPIYAGKYFSEKYGPTILNKKRKNVQLAPTTWRNSKLTFIIVSRFVLIVSRSMFTNLYVFRLV